MSISHTGRLPIFRQWHAENALIFAKYAGFLVYVRYLLEVFSRFEDPRARFGHRGVALISDRGAAEVTN